MSALAGFVTGFANVTAANILERKKEARDYFNKQVEYARTTGMENRRKVREAADAALSLANQLKQAGLPEDIIKAQINQDPTGLSSFYEQAEKIRANAGRDLTADEWNAIYRVAGDFKAPEEDLATFISRTYDPISDAASQPDFQDDPEGTLLSRMMGYNAMDQARAELGRTEIGEGMTAEQLIRYGDVTPQRVGGRAVVTTDYSALPGEEEELSVTEANRVSEVVETQVDAALSQIESANGVVEGADMTPLRDAVVAELSELYPMVSPATIQRFADAAIRRRRYTVGGQEATTPLGGPETLTEPPPVVPGTEGSQEAPPPSTVPSGASTGQPSITEEFGERPPVITLPAEGKTLTFVSDNGDGTSTFIDQDGIEYQLNNDAVRSYYRQ